MALGVVYLAFWPIRVHLSARKKTAIPISVGLLPGIGGIILIVFDVTGLRNIQPDLWLYAAFTHGFLLLFGSVFAARWIYRKSDKRKTE